MAHIWVVEIWIRNDDGTGRRNWRMDFGLTRTRPHNYLAVIWKGGGPLAFTSRARARIDAKSTRRLLAVGFKKKDFGVRVAKYVRG